MVGKGGPKLRPALVSADNQPVTALGVDGKPRQSILIKFPPSGISIHAPAASLATVAEAISRFTERPVVDMTGLEGQYEFELTFEPETMRGMLDPRAGPDGSRMAPGDPALSISDAVRQYGLKLEARKAPIEMLTVTRVEKTPTAN